MRFIVVVQPIEDQLMDAHGLILQLGSQTIFPFDTGRRGHVETRRFGDFLTTFGSGLATSTTVASVGKGETRSSLLLRIMMMVVATVIGQTAF